MNKMGTKVSMVVMAALTATSVAACASDHNDRRADETVKAQEPTAELVADFDLSKSELPEGIVVQNGVPYVGLALTSQIARVDTGSGKWSLFGTLPKAVPNLGFMTGLAASPADPGAIYGALASFTPEVQAGIYRVSDAGGEATPFAKHPDMAFPNGIATDETKNFYVTDSAAGAVFRVSPSGDKVDEWIKSDLLAGDKDNSCAKAAGAGVSFNIGANGIVKQGGDWFVTNSDKGTIVRISVADNGDARKAELFSGPNCEALGGADGIDSDGENLIVAMNYQNKVSRVDSAGRAEVLVAGSPLDFPASPGVSGKTLYVTNFAFATAASGKGRPALVRIDDALGR